MIGARIAALWRGDAPLARIFWDYAICWGTLLNLVCGGAALVIFVNRGPALLALLIHFAPLPYNFLVTVATWRAAARARGTALAGFAQAVILIWFVLMLVV